MPGALPWIQTDGGPSVALPYEKRDLWEGSDPPSAGRSVSDYDRACEAAHFVGLVPCDGFVALAIARGPIAWLPQPGGGVLVHWEYGDSRQAVEAMLIAALGPEPGTAPVAWTPTPLRLPVDGGKLIVFDAAYRGSQPPKQHLLLTVAPGLYTIDQADFEPDDSTCMTLYRFSR